MEPKYLVQTTEGRLYSYWRLAVMLSDISLNKYATQNKLVQVFEAKRGLGTLTYEPTTVERLKQTFLEGEEL
jgi:hypothetical protein